MGKSSERCPTKGPIKSPTTWSQVKAQMSLSGVSAQTLPLVQLAVVSSPTGANLRLRHVASPRSQPAESVNPNSFAVVMKEMKDAVVANDTIEPTSDKIEAEYQCRLVLECTTGLQLPPFMLGVTSPILSHALNVSGPTQLTAASDHQSAVVTNVVECPLGSLSLTWFATHGNCLQGYWANLAQPFK